MSDFQFPVLKIGHICCPERAARCNFSFSVKSADEPKTRRAVRLYRPASARLPRERLRHLADGSDGVKGVPQGEKLAHGKPGSPYSTLLRPRSKGSRFRRKRFPPARCCRGRNSCPRKDAPGRSGAECNRPSQFATVLQNGVQRSVIVRRSVPFPERNRGCQLKIRNC